MKIKTKKASRRLAPGIREETYKRQGVEYSQKKYETASLAAFREMSGGAFGEDRIKALAAWATEWLKAEGLPYEKKVYYARLKKADTIKTSDLITKAEFDEKFDNVDPAISRDGGRFGGMSLTEFIEKLGYGRLDYPYLMAEIIVLADRILDPATPRGTVLDATFNLGGIYEKIQLFLRGDKQTGSPRDRKSLKPYVADILIELGDIHYMVVLSELEKKGAEVIGDRVKWGEKSITINRFKNIVYEEKKRLKEEKIHT